MTSIKNNLSKISLNNSDLFPDYNSSLQSSKRCYIGDKIGIITPKNSDSFSSNSKENSLTETKIIKDNNQICHNKKVIKIKIVSSSYKSDTKPLDPFDLFNSNSNSDKENKEPNIPPFKATQEYYREINHDSIESIIPCKPLLTSTSSKAFMNEYSKTKQYKEDKINFFSTSDSEDTFPIPNPNKLLFNSTETQSPIIEDREDSKYDMDTSELLKFQELNLPVPLKKKDDENFKILTMKKMKRKTMPSYKSTRKFAEDKEPSYEKDFRIHNNYCTLLKRKIVHSLRRIYSSNFVLKKGDKDFNFMIFRDKDIGIYEYWQAHIHETNNDEDFDTDEEQKKLAKCFTFGELKEALVYIKDKSFEECFINFNRFNNFRTEEENAHIKEKIDELKKDMKL